MALSALAHGALLAPVVARRLAPPEAPPALARSAHLDQRSAGLALTAALVADRRALVEGARAARAEGRLELGAFLIDANAIDAREQRRAFDRERARALYDARVGRLRLAPWRTVRRAIPEIFGDLHYFGRPGGSMGDALLAGGGSCEPLAHLLASAVHDAGDPERAALRFYGGEDEGGATHLAPVFPDGAGEYDLLTGGPAQRTGARMAASDLVDAYARAHGLAPELPDAAEPSGAGGGGAPEAGTKAQAAPSMAVGYPKNRDRFPGTTPLFAARAVGAATDRAALPARDPGAQAVDCAFFARMAVLDPPSLLVGEPGVAAFSVELRRVPTAAQLDRTFALIKAVEQSLAPAASSPAAPEPDPAERLMGLACLAALYDKAAVDFALSSDPDLAARAAEKQRRAAEDGAALLAAVDWSAPSGRQLLRRLSERFGGRNWLLLLLRGGDGVVLRLVSEAGKDDWGRINALAALTLSPSVRPAAMAILDGLPRRHQVDVMHEVFHAHDHQRPWASNYALEEADERAFSRAYRVFRGVAWGLWEGSRPAPEVLDALLARASRERLDRGWVVSFLEYYGRNALGLHAARADGRDFAYTLARWLGEHGFAELELYRTALETAEDPT